MKLTVATTGLLLLLLGSSATAFKTFQAAIPNGDKVGDPCQSGAVWQGVGHWNKDGRGERNPFGRAFFGNGKVWNATLCRLDSDGDGRTNGDELGDPQCVWVAGGTPARVTGITHPGVCEPVNSALCKGLNGDKISCGSTGLKGALGLLLAMLLASFLLR